MAPWPSASAANSRRVGRAATYRLLAELRHTGRVGRLCYKSYTRADLVVLTRVAQGPV